MARINKKAKARIKRIEEATLHTVLNKEAVIQAFKKQYKLLGVDFPKKIIWKKDLVFGFKAAADAARGAAWGAAWDAAAINTGLKDKATLKLIAIETQTLKALENGLAWYFPMQDKLILVPLPEFSFDEEQKLHAENKPAIYWKGGAKFYFYHGVKVDKKLIESPEKLTKKDWLNESNLEIRRVIQERMPDFAKKIGGKKIDTSEKGELIEVDLGSDPEKIARYVKVKDGSTAREYFLRVPPTIQKVNEGIAWTFGLEAKKYKPIKET